MSVSSIQLTERTKKRLAALRQNPRETYEQTIERLMGMKYADAGVDIETGDFASKAFYQAAKTSWATRTGIGQIVAPFDDFSGLRYVDVSGLKNTAMGTNVDTVGTKVEIAERLQKYDTLAFDLLAMVCEDAVVRGAEPIAVTNTIECNKVLLEPMQQLANGLQKAAKEANVAVLNGEIAEVGDRVKGYGAFAANWGASCVWLARKNRLIDGKAVKPGHTIITLKEDGFRSNGLSLARRIMEKQYGKNWHDYDRKMAERMLHPSTLYTRFAVSLFGGVEAKPSASVSTMVHVTGGGIPGKLGRALKPSGLGAELTNLFPPCKAMEALKEMGPVEIDEAYRTWNMGNGFLIVSDEPDAILNQANVFKLKAKIAGEISKKPKILLKN